MNASELRTLIADTLSLEDPAVPFHELAHGQIAQWDSLGHVQIIARLEEVTGNQFTAKQIAQMTSFQAIANELGIEHTSC